MGAFDTINNYLSRYNFASIQILFAPENGLRILKVLKFSTAQLGNFPNKTMILKFEPAEFSSFNCGLHWKANFQIRDHDVA
jgi:hypothetical protein